jgi:alpha-glucuronidase
MASGSAPSRQHQAASSSSPATARGAVYGVFALERAMTLGADLTTLDRTETPASPQRWVNEWDNLDGSIERGYGGRSVFFGDNHVLQDLTKARSTRACWRQSA